MSGRPTIETVGVAVVARRRIDQSPLSRAPAVPRGRRGTVEDLDQPTGDYLVDFGGRYGVVVVAPTEVR